MSLRRISDSGRSSRGDIVVRVGEREAVTGKMLAHGAHAGVGEALDDRAGERADGVGVEMQRAVADHAASAVVEVEHRREAEVDAVRAELGADDVRRGARRLLRQVPVAVPEPAELAHRRDAAEAVAEALHPAAFMVDADRQCRLSQLFDFFDQCLELVRGSRNCGQTG